MHIAHETNVIVVLLFKIYLFTSKPKSNYKLLNFEQHTQS